MVGSLTTRSRILTGALSLLLACTFSAVPNTAEAACARVNVSGTDRVVDPNRIDQQRLNAAVLAEVNYLRCRKGLSTLDAPSRLRKVAADHSRWMASHSRLSHTSDRRGRQTPQERVVSTGLVKRMGSENIAKVSLYRLDQVGRFRIDDAARCQFRTYSGTRITPHTYGSLARYVAELWYESKAHRKNLMDGRARLTATGAGYDARGRNCGSLYLTQNFAG